MNRIRREPVVTATLGFVAAVIATLVAFGVTLTEEQVHALRTLGEAALVLAFYVRSKVTPGG